MQIEYYIILGQNWNWLSGLMSPSRRRQRQQPIFYLFYVNCFQDLGEDFAISWRNLSEKTEKNNWNLSRRRW